MKTIQRAWSIPTLESLSCQGEITPIHQLGDICNFNGLVLMENLKTKPCILPKQFEVFCSIFPGKKQF
jgi:hypothetical protein